jgi:hypothetical protein
MIEIANLHGEARYGDGVLANSSVDGAHLRFELGEYSHDVLQQRATILGLHLDIDQMRQTGVGKPLGLHDPLRRRIHESEVGAIGAMHAHAAADRNVTHDWVARYRRAALREAHEHVVDAGDSHAARTADAFSQHGLAADLRKIDDLVVFHFVAYAIGDGLRGRVAESDCRKEIRRRRIVQARRNTFDQLAASGVRA